MLTILKDSTALSIAPHIPGPGDHDQGDPSRTENKAMRATNEVLLSADILPVILLHLKNMHPEAGNPTGPNALILPVLRVNKAFFDAGIHLVWAAVEGLEPLFGLLPPYGALYEHAQVPDGAKADDWDRFNLYASCVRTFKMAWRDPEHPPLWVQSLGELPLPGMPVPLLPNLRAVSLSPVDFMSPNTLALFIPPSLTRFLVDLDKISLEGDPPRLLPSVVVQIILPLAQNLKFLHYTGPTDSDFISHLVTLTSLTTLILYLSGWQDHQQFRRLHELPLLEHITILVLDSVRAASADNSMKGAWVQPHNSLTNLRSLGLLLRQYQHCLIAQALAPRNLTEVLLGFLGATDCMPVHLAAGLFLQGNPDLGDLDLRFASANLTPEPSFPESRVYYWPSLDEASDTFSSALQKSKSIIRISILDIPFHMAIPTVRVIRAALPSFGSSLVSLSVLVSLEPTENTTQYGPAAYPGLSFLESTIRPACPNLLNLAFPFDARLICEEPLGEPRSEGQGLSNDDDSMSGLEKERPLRKHGLCVLEICTGTPQNGNPPIKIPPRRQLDIASFIARLFPNLGPLKGRGAWEYTTWEKVSVLLHLEQLSRRRSE